jgi:hypothetical protein
MRCVRLALIASSLVACHQHSSQVSLPGIRTTLRGKQPAPVQPKAVPAVDASAPTGQAPTVSEIASFEPLANDRDAWPVGLHPIGSEEAYVSFGLNLGHITRSGVVFSPDSSRGLPVQTDPCIAPIVDEIRRERLGRLVLTLKDAGHPHYGAGCPGGERVGVGYVWESARWVPKDLPAWAQSSTRYAFQEIRLAGKTVRLMGPRVAPHGDGVSSPEDWEHLPVCFGAKRPTLEGWDLPDGLPSLPRDLCVEAVAFGTSGTDVLLFGRSEDGAMWLERVTPKTGSARTRVQVPAWCQVLRSSDHSTWLGGVDDGKLLIQVSCRKSKGYLDLEERAFLYHYATNAGRIAVTPIDERPESPAPPERVELGNHFELQRASSRPPPGPILEDSPKQSARLVHDRVTVLAPVLQAIAFGDNAVIAQQGGRLLLVRASSSPASSAPPTAKFTGSLVPEGRFLSLPKSLEYCEYSAFLFARIPADEHAAARLEATRAALGALVRAHPEVGRGPEYFVEFRIGDEILVGRHWSFVKNASWPRLSSFQQRVQTWSRARGLNFERTCIFEYPSGEGRTYHFGVSGEITWVDRERAILVRVWN